MWLYKTTDVRKTNSRSSTLSPKNSNHFKLTYFTCFVITMILFCFVFSFWKEVSVCTAAYVAEVGPELATSPDYIKLKICLPQSPECRYYRHAPLCPATLILLVKKHPLKTSCLKVCRWSQIMMLRTVENLCSWSSFNSNKTNLKSLPDRIGFFIMINQHLVGHKK
jgi:hypothetical protein